MKTYSVWVQIEEYDDETDEYSEVDVPGFASTASFDTEEEAQVFAQKLHDLGEAL